MEQEDSLNTHSAGKPDPSLASPASTGLSSRRGMVLGVLLLLSIAGLSWWSLTKIEEQTRHDLESTLSTVLHTTHEALHLWSRERISDINSWTDVPKLQNSMRALLNLPTPSREILLGSPQLSELRSIFGEAMNRQGYLSFALIDTQNRVLAATEDSLLGKPHLLSTNGNFLKRVFEGETLISLPMVAEVLLPNPFGEYAKNQPTMFVVGPVRNASNQVVAALAFRIDPHKDFTRITQLGRIGQSGETYAFDQNAKLLTGSRFTQDLIQTGLLRPGERDILSVDIRDPGGNLVEGYRTEVPRLQQPLTLMAASAVDGESGVNTRGYNDYRGIPVVGVWLWDSKLQLGLATEMDVDEAFSSYKSTRWLVLLTLSLVLVLLLAFALTQTRGRMQAVKMAFQIRERESQITAVLDNVVDAILTVNEEDRIESFNNAAEHIFGYLDTEVLGKRFSMLLPAPEDEQFPETDELQGEETYTPINFESLNQHGDLYGVRKDGSTFPMELNSSRVKFENRTLVIVIVRDISDRRRAEMEIRKASDELEHRVQERTRDLETALKNVEAEINKRQEFEQNLKDSNAFLSSILGSPTDISIVSTDLEGTIIYWNQGAENLLGYKAEEMVNKQTVSVLYPQDGESQKLAGEMVKKIVETKKGASFEVEELAKDGRRIWVQLTLSPRLNAQGEVIGILGIGGNITDLKHTEATLKQQSTYLQMLETIAHASSQASNANEGLQTCLDQVCSVLDWPMANLFLMAEDSSGDLVCPAIHVNKELARFRNFRTLTELTRFSRGEDLPGRVLQTGAPAWVSDVRHDLNPSRAREARAAEIQNGFAFPILFGSEVLGVMEFFSGEVRHQDPKLFEVMAQVGHQMGRILNRKRADRLLKRTQDFLQLYQCLAEAAYNSQSLQEALQSSLDYLCDIHNWPVGHLLLPDGNTHGSWVSSGLWHLKDPDAARNFRKVSEEHPFEESQGFPASVGETRHFQWIPDLNEEREFQRARMARTLALVSAWAFPLVHRQKVFGILECYGVTQTKPDKAFLEGMEEVCGLLAQMIYLQGESSRKEETVHRYQTLLDHAPLGMMTLAPDGEILSFNPAAEFILGYRAEDALGQNISALFPEAYASGADAWMARAANLSPGFSSALHQTVVGLRQNGTPVQVQLGISRSNNNGNPLFVVSLQYTAQAALKTERRHPQLAAPEPELPSDKPLELAPPQRRFPLADQMNEVGNDTIQIAHDFNSPVFGVRKLVEHIRGMLTLQDHQKVLFDLLDRKINRISGGIRRLKEFYRPQSGIGGPVDINEMLEDILVLGRNALIQRHVKLETHLAEDLPKVDAVSDQIHQALQNLLHHSEETLPEAGGEIMIATELEEDQIKIYLMDNGKSMPPGYLETVFDPILSGSSTADLDPNLPLQYAVNIIRTHGGSIEIARREENGNIYTVALPIRGPK